MAKYNLLQCVKLLEKLFQNNIDSEEKIKKLRWEDLKQFNPIEKSFIMDLKVAVAKRKSNRIFSWERKKYKEEIRVIEHYKKSNS